MPLKFKFKSKDEVPAELQAHYVERDGAWFLDAEGAVEKARLEEFRANNVLLMKERDELRQRFEGIDPEQARKVAEEKRKAEEERQLKSGDLETVVQARLKGAKADFERQLAGVSQERDSLNARLTAIEIDQAVVSEGAKRGLRPSAIPDLTARARHTFRLVNGVPQAFESDGQTVRVAKDGQTPLSLAEWIDLQVGEAPHLFESNAGSGAVGDGSGGAGGKRSVNNPFRKETWNLTAQMTLQKTDPALAARLKAAAS